jgi:hypothetical protein
MTTAATTVAPASWSADAALCSLAPVVYVSSTSQERKTAHIHNRLEGGISCSTVSGNARPWLQGVEHREACVGES